MSSESSEFERVSLKDVNRRIDFHVELGTPLFIELGGMEGRLKSTLVGMEPGSNIMARIPMIPGIRDKLYEGNRVVVRYVHCGSVYGFESIVLGFVMKPTQIMFISYPKVIEIHNLRKYQRVDCFFPVEIEVGRQRCSGAILDISTGGCRLVAELKNPMELSVGGAIKLHFQLSGSRPISGIAQNINRDSEKAVVGVAFNCQETEQRRNIETYVAEMLRY